jgi:hypothetical protein
VLVNLPGSLALWAFGVGRMQRVDGRGFQRQLRDVAVQEREALLSDENAVGKP